MSAEVAVVVVAYNSARQIEPCLRSLLDANPSVRQQVIVVDNASADGTADLVRAKFPGVTLVASERNLGFAAGVNLGARHADAEFILLLNPDTVVLDRAVEVLVAFARAHPGCGLVGGRTLKPDGSLEPSSCWGLPNLWSLFLFACGLSTVGRRNRFLDPESLGSWPRDTVREVGVITGCLLLVSSEAWRRLGGLDERYFLYGEDVDFSMRARLAGYRPTICPEARIIHEIGQSSATATQKQLMLYRGKTCFFRTHYRGARLRLALVLLKAGVGLRFVLARVAAALRRGQAANDWGAVWRARRQWLEGYPAKRS